MTFSVIDGPHVGTSGTDVTDSTGTATFSYTGTTTGTDTIKATFVDSEDQTQTSNLVTKTWIESPNMPPDVDAGGPYDGNEGSPGLRDGTVTDPDPDDAITTSWSSAPASGVDAGATCEFETASSVDTTVTCTDDGTYTLTLTATTASIPSVLDTATLTLANADPSVVIGDPDR